MDLAEFEHDHAQEIGEELCWRLGINYSEGVTPETIENLKAENKDMYREILLALGEGVLFND